MYRIVDSAIKSKFIDRVVIYGLRDQETPSVSIPHPQVSIQRFYKPFHSQNLILRILSFLIWGIKIFYNAISQSVTSVHAHSLSVLPLSTFISLMKGAKLVYEPHEFETETHSVSEMRKKLSRFVEGAFIKYVDLFYVVSDGISKEYKKLYPSMNPHVVRNLPSTVGRNLEAMVQNRDIRREFNVGKDDLLFVYQGILAPERGTEFICQAFRDLPRNSHILFIGDGASKEVVVENSKIYKNIHYIGMVGQVELSLLTMQCDIGVVFLDESCLNHELALPNKFFQYLSCTIPVLVSDRLEMGNYIDEWKIGWKFNSEQNFLEKILSLNHNEVAKAKFEINKFNSENNWEKEEIKLLSILSSIWTENNIE